MVRGAVKNIVEEKEDQFFHGLFKPRKAFSGAEQQIPVALPNEIGQQDEVNMPQPIGKVGKPERAEQSGRIGDKQPKRGNANPPERGVIQLDIGMGGAFFPFTHGLFRFGHLFPFGVDKVRKFNS